METMEVTTPQPEQKQQPINFKGCSKLDLSRVTGMELSLEIGSEYLVWSVSTGLMKKEKIVASGLISSQDLSNTEKLNEYLESLISCLGISKISVNIDLSIPDCLLRCFYIPVVPKGEIEKVIKWEGNKVFPYKLENALFDWKVIEKVQWAGANKYEVQVAAVPEKKILPIFEFFVNRKLQIKRITFSYLSWEKIFKEQKEKSDTEKDGNFSLIRLVGNNLTILFFHNYYLEFVRENRLETNNQSGGFEDSLKYLSDDNTESVTSQFVFDDINYDSVAQDIVNSVDYYYGQFSQRSIEKIYLAFPEKIQDEAVAQLGKSLDFPIDSIYTEEVQKCITPEVPGNLILPSSFKEKTKYQVLNLLPNEYKSEISEKKRFRTVLVFGAIAILFLTLFSVLMFRQTNVLEKNHESLENNLFQIEASEAYARVENMISREQMFRTQLNSIQSENHETSMFLKAISILTPTSIKLNNLNSFRVSEDVEGKKVHISMSGFVTPDAVYPEIVLAEYVKSLKKLPQVNQLDLKGQKPVLVSGGKILEFDIEMELH